MNAASNKVTEIMIVGNAGTGTIPYPIDDVIYWANRSGEFYFVFQDKPEKKPGIDCVRPIYRNGWGMVLTQCEILNLDV